jgi:iron(III) transport system substrate-binding protein
MERDRATPGGLSRRSVLSFAAGAAAATIFPTRVEAQSLTIEGETIGSAELLRAAKAEGSLLSYTVNFEEMERALLERFREDTGIKSEVIRLAAGRLFERIMSEHAAKRLQADLISLTDTQLMGRLIAEKILVPHMLPNWDAIPAGLKEPNGYYYAMNRFVTVLGYNSSVWTKEQAPKSWVDLLDPKFKRQVGVVQAAAGGMSWTVALFQRQVVDPVYWEKLAANEPRIYTSQAPLADDLARGEVTVAYTTPGLIRNLLDAGAPVGLHFPKEGAPAVATQIGATSTGRSPNASKLLLNWAMSKRGGKAISEIFADYPAHPGAPPPEMAKHGIALSPANELWIAPEGDFVSLRDKWIPEWDRIVRGQRGR